EYDEEDSLVYDTSQLYWRVAPEWKQKPEDNGQTPEFIYISTDINPERHRNRLMLAEEEEIPSPPSERLTPPPSPKQGAMVPEESEGPTAPVELRANQTLPTLVPAPANPILSPTDTPDEEAVPPSNDFVELL